MFISDATDSATVVGVRDSSHVEIPQFIKDNVDQTYTFQLKLTELNSPQNTNLSLWHAFLSHMSFHLQHHYQLI